MPIFSRERLVWEGPTETVDGDTVDPASLAYEMGVDSDGSGLVPVMSLPGTLSTETGPSGGPVFEAPIGDTLLGVGDHSLAVRAVNPAGGNPSDWSNELPLLVTVNPTPAAPVLLDL